MYRMLLPLDANAERHFSTDTGSRSGVWADWFRVSWAMIAQVFRGPRD